MSFLLGLPIFRGYVKFQGCILHNGGDKMVYFFIPWEPNPLKKKVTQNQQMQV